MYEVGAVATYRQSLHNDEMHTPNALAFLTPDLAVYSNDHWGVRRTSAVVPTLENVLGLPGGSLVLLDVRTGRHRTVARGLAFANGVAYHRQKGLLAVASTSVHTISLYRVHLPEPMGDTAFDEIRLEFLSKTSVDFHPDNLHWSSVDPDVLLAAGHPYIFHVLAAVRDPFRRKAGSKAVALRLEDVHLLFERSLLFDDGHYFGTASTATEFYTSKTDGIKGLLFSGLYSLDGLLFCREPQ